MAERIGNVLYWLGCIAAGLTVLAGVGIYVADGLKIDGPYSLWVSIQFSGHTLGHRARVSVHSLSAQDVKLTDCAELNGDCPSQVTRLYDGGLAPPAESNSRWPVARDFIESGNVPTNPR